MCSGISRNFDYYDGVIKARVRKIWLNDFDYDFNGFSMNRPFYREREYSPVP